MQQNYIISSCILKLQQISNQLAFANSKKLCEAEHNQNTHLQIWNSSLVGTVPLQHWPGMCSQITVPSFFTIDISWRMTGIESKPQITPLTTKTFSIRKIIREYCTFICLVVFSQFISQIESSNTRLSSSEKDILETLLSALNTRKCKWKKVLLVTVADCFSKYQALCLCRKGGRGLIFDLIHRLGPAG